MHRKLHYISKCNKLVQLVVQVLYHKNVIYSLGGGHTHTHAHTHTKLRGQKQFQEARRALAFGWHTPGLKVLIIITNVTYH